MDHSSPEAIKQLRRRFKLSQGRLAKIVGIGSYDLCRYENGHEPLTASKLEAIAEYFEAREKGGLNV